MTKRHQPHTSPTTNSLRKLRLHYVLTNYKNQLNTCTHIIEDEDDSEIVSCKKQKLSRIWPFFVKVYPVKNLSKNTHSREFL